MRYVRLEFRKEELQRKFLERFGVSPENPEVLITIVDEVFDDEPYIYEDINQNGEEVVIIEGYCRSRRFR
jgi:hypothetical protein